MGDIEHPDDGTVWIDGETYSPLTDRERAFVSATVFWQDKAKAALAREQGAVEAIERIGDAINAVESGGGRVAANVHEAYRAALAAVRGR